MLWSGTWWTDHSGWWIGTKFFEELEPPEGVRAELLRGEIVLSRSSDLVHNHNVMEAVDQIPRKHWSRLQTQCVDMLADVSAPVPDLVVIERGAGPDQGTYLPMAHCVLFTEPKGTGGETEYEMERTSKFGCPIPMEHLGIELDTTGFGTFSNVKPHRHP